MGEHAGATAINNLRGAVVKAQHKITESSAMKELIIHLSGVGHLEVLGIAKGAAPIKANYEEWLKTEDGKKAKAGVALNNAYNTLVKTLFNCYSAAAKDAKVVKTKAGEAYTAAEKFLKDHHVPANWSAGITVEMNKVKTYK